MSLDLKQNQNLLELNSFRLPSRAQYFCEVTCVDDVLAASEFARSKQIPVWVLGGGSNVILTEHIPGLCLQIAIKGRSIDGNTVTLGAGENWHETVLFTLDGGLSGLENLALIPGQVGAAPMQNIGAYGVELAESLLRVKGVELQSKQVFEFAREDCQFGYRDSVFKRAKAARYVITEVELALDHNFVPRLEYAGIQAQLGARTLSAKAVCDAVIELRTSKLPDPAICGNAGSFFKNPVVSSEHYQSLQALLPGIQGFNEADGVKVSAAVLIEACGLKGKIFGGARVSERHALVLENAGHAVAEDVLHLASRIQLEVQTRFNVQLEIEPRVIPE